MNFWLGKSDWKEKHNASKKGMYIYCVRGNHEERPENIPSMNKVYDENVQGNVWMEEEFPLIRYFDCGSYNINGLKTLVINGAYSVDKYYRLQNNIPWFKDEQATVAEKELIDFISIGEHYDLVLAHTCPLSWQPTDLFLNFIDQSMVDNSMEQWLENLKEYSDWGIYLFGHYHRDRFIRPGVEMFYTDVEPLEDIVERWKNPEEVRDNYCFEFDPKYDYGR